MRLLATLVMLSASLGQAQVETDLTPPPVMAVPAEPPADQPEAPSFLQRCFAVPGQVWIPTVGGRYYAVNPATSSAPLSSFHTAQPVGSPGSGPSAPSGGSSGGGGSIDGKALLVLAVVIVAALPVIVYAVDSDAPAVVEQRFHCPSFGFDAVGGVDLGDSVGPAGSGSGRFTFGIGYFGSDFQFDLSAGSINAWSGHLLLRILPKSHLEPNLAFGFRTMSLGGRTRSGLEVGVPHRYVLWREGLRQFSIELRPTFMFGLGSFDVGLEAALLIPLVEPIHLRAGGKVQSFGNEVIGGFNAGLSFSL
ncbi:MAG: hypothetical protein Q8L48_19200 [Archangium sp.]|nr:hypothetical protein [Archangium sp.]